MWLCELDWTDTKYALETEKCEHDNLTSGSAEGINWFSFSDYQCFKKNPVPRVVLTVSLRSRSFLILRLQDWWEPNAAESARDVIRKQWQREKWKRLQAIRQLQATHQNNFRLHVQSAGGELHLDCIKAMAVK